MPSIFMSQPTCIDHAYINQLGLVVGGSINPNFIVTGELDKQEQVVVDFSQIKKQIKAAIDDRITGFDHKLWIIEGYSNCKLYEESSPGSWKLITDKKQLLDMPPQDRIRIISDMFDMIMPVDAVRFIPTRRAPSSKLEFNRVICDNMTAYLEDKLYDIHNKLIDVTVIHQEQPHLFGKDYHAMFTYTHGLPFSTSYGCQNQNHGHLSWVQVVGHELSDTRLMKELTDQIALFLHNAVFIDQSNIVDRSKESISIEYTTEQRGYFQATYTLGPRGFRALVLPADTTIENIIEFVLRQPSIDTLLRQATATHLAISEGLSKGAIISID